MPYEACVRDVEKDLQVPTFRIVVSNINMASSNLIVHCLILSTIHCINCPDVAAKSEELSTV